MKIIQKIIADYFSNDYQNNNKYIKLIFLSLKI